MSLYAPSQVLGMIPGLTMRELTDIYQKGLVTPAEESPGQGSPARYNDENVLQIAVAASLRKTLPPKLVKLFMQNDYERVKNDDILSFKLGVDGSIYSLRSFRFDDFESAKEYISRTSFKYKNVRGFLTVSLNLAGLRMSISG